MDFMGSLWVVLFEGVGVTEVAACVGAARLLDAFVALLGPGIVDQFSPAWTHTAKKAITSGTLRRTLDHLCVGDFEYNVIRPEWLAISFRSSEAAAGRQVEAGPPTWEFWKALLRLLDVLEGDAWGQIAEALGVRTLAAMDEFLGGALGATLEGDEKMGTHTPPSSSSSSSSLAGFPSVLSPLPPTRRSLNEEGGLDSTTSEAPPQWPTHTQKIACLRRLRLSVVGSSVSLLLPGKTPTVLVDRVVHQSSAALFALSLATLPGIFLDSTEGGNPPPPLKTPAAAVTRTVSHFFSAPPTPPPMVPPPTRDSPILSPVHLMQQQSSGGNSGGGGGGDGKHSNTIINSLPASTARGGFAAATNGEIPTLVDSEEALKVASSVLSQLFSPCDVLGAKGNLLCPGAPPQGAADAGAGKLHCIHALLPLNALPPPHQLLPLEDPPPLYPDEGFRRLSTTDKTRTNGGQKSRGVSPLGARGGGWGGAASTLKSPHVLVSLLILQPPSPNGERETSALTRFSDLSTDAALKVIESSVQRACLSVSKAEALRHLGAFLCEGQQDGESGKGGV